LSDNPTCPICELSYVADYPRMFVIIKSFTICNHKTIASIYVEAGRVVGLLVERDCGCVYKIHLGDEHNAVELPETMCRRLDVVWVLKSHRGKAIGKQLLKSFMDRNADKPLAVQAPISDDGQRLLRSPSGLNFGWAKSRGFADDRGYSPKLKKSGM